MNMRLSTDDADRIKEGETDESVSPLSRSDIIHPAPPLQTHEQPCRRNMQQCLHEENRKEKAPLHEAAVLLPSEFPAAEKGRFPRRVAYSASSASLCTSIASAAAQAGQSQ